MQVNEFRVFCRRCGWCLKNVYLTAASGGEWCSVIKQDVSEMCLYFRREWEGEANDSQRDLGIHRVRHTDSHRFFCQLLKTKDNIRRYWRWQGDKKKVKTSHKDTRWLYQKCIDADGWSNTWQDTEGETETTQKSKDQRKCYTERQ